MSRSGPRAIAFAGNLSSGRTRIEGGGFYSPRDDGDVRVVAGKGRAQPLDGSSAARRIRRRVAAIDHGPQPARAQARLAGAGAFRSLYRLAGRRLTRARRSSTRVSRVS